MFEKADQYDMKYALKALIRSGKVPEKEVAALLEQRRHEVSRLQNRLVALGGKAVAPADRRRTAAIYASRVGRLPYGPVRSRIEKVAKTQGLGAAVEILTKALDKPTRTC